jgi:hypothetical protein
MPDWLDREQNPISARQPQLALRDPIRPRRLQIPRLRERINSQPLNRRP